MENLIPRSELNAGSLIYLPNLDINEQVFCRGMLFKLNKESLAQDLIYTTPTNYPIYNNDSIIDSNFLITHSINLDALLIYLGFSEMLTRQDLNHLYKKFISHNWWINHNKQLFGYGIKDEIIPKIICEELINISSERTGLPYKEEPGYAFIKRRQ